MIAAGEKPRDRGEILRRGAERDGRRPALGPARAAGARSAQAILPPGAASLDGFPGGH
jgi:hypothetical protein